jgi:hypothetical protein
MHAGPARHSGRRHAASVAAGLTVLLLPLGLHGQDRPHRAAVHAEVGAVWQGVNDVEIPNDGSATRFSLFELAGKGPWPAGRVYVSWYPADRHDLRLLVAPLSISASGTPGAPIRFAGATYTAGSPVRASYTFNSYRLTYRYRLSSSSRSSAWIGVTGKIRDATIALQQGATASRKDDLGFVPLLHLAGEWQPTPAWRITLDADAIAGGPGRAEDAALKLRRDIGARWSVESGYRLVEGGADVPDVYTFAWLHYAVIGLTRKW